jgi:hypothetical protein
MPARPNAVITAKGHLIERCAELLAVRMEFAHLHPIENAADAKRDLDAWQH